MRAMVLTVLGLLLAGSWAGTAAAGEPAGAAGRWRGRWFDDPTGHSGPLRASIRQTPRGDYRAWFTGRFAGVVPFAFGARLQPAGVAEDGRLLLQGSQGLGPFGAFRYAALTDGRTLEATFAARRWSGRFSLAR